MNYRSSVRFLFCANDVGSAVRQSVHKKCGRSKAFQDEDEVRTGSVATGLAVVELQLPNANWRGTESQPAIENGNGTPGRYAPGSNFV